MKLQSEVVLVTPALAAEWLAANHTENRPVREARVRTYAAEILAGRWRITHQGIAFDAAGVLLDGQHRLTAVVRANVAVYMMVTRGLDVETFAVLDQGAFRSAADILRLPTWHVASLRALMALERYDQHFMHRAQPHELETRYKQGVETITILRELNPAHNGFTNGPIIGALAYAYPVDPSGVASFFIQVARGEMLERTDPAYRLRAWIEMRRGRGLTGAGGWPTMMVTLQAFHHMIIPGTHKIAALHVGETGYRVISGRRRARAIPNTPSATELPVSEPR